VEGLVVVEAFVVEAFVVEAFVVDYFFDILLALPLLLN